MINVENYIKECYKMAKLKSENPDLVKIYRDVNFPRLIEKANLYQDKLDDLKLAERIFDERD